MHDQPLLIRLTEWMNKGDPQWALRRRLVWIITIWSMGLSVWALGYEDDRAITTQLIKTSADTLFWVLTIYVGGAVADDNARRYIKYGSGNGQGQSAGAVPRPSSQPPPGPPGQNPPGMPG